MSYAEEFNINTMPEVQGNNNFPAIPQTDNRGIISDVIKGYSNTVSTVPNVMVEQRNSFMAMFDVMDKMENMGMIKVNRPQPVVEEEDEVPTWVGTVILIGLVALAIAL